METETLEFGHFYHIFNRGNNRENIFPESENYSYFLKLFNKYISPIAEIYAYCLLKNHFHFLIKLKDSDKIETDELKFSTIETPRVILPSKQFSHFFNAYTQAINKKYKRTGSLFEKPFERKKIKDEKYFRQLILYIHNNPVEHRFVENPEDYRWSSYNAILSDRKTQVKRDDVLNYFGNKENFIFSHKNYETLNLPY